MTYFESDQPRYSYAEVNDEFVIRTAEKVVISTHALIGAYFFSSASMLIATMREILAQPLKISGQEYTLSTVYNQLIGRFGRVTASSAIEYHSFGTPEELRNYELWKGLQYEKQKS